MDEISPAEIVVIDDAPENLRFLTTFLTQDGYSVRAFPDPELALGAIKEEPPDLILLDITMPALSGFEVCETLKADPSLCHIPIIFISGLSDTSDIAKALDIGGADYVTKPFQFAELRARVQAHLEIFQLRSRLQLLDAGQVALPRTAVERETIATLSRLAEYDDPDIGAHIDRTRSHCRILASALVDANSSAIASRLTLPDALYHAAALHDVGNVVVPSSILRKPGKLSEDEFETMTAHASAGAGILREIQKNHPDDEFIACAIEIAQSHHEKWDGSGYPQGLSGADIPLSARIMAVADVYDALRSERCYKKAVPHRESVDCMQQASGRHFDPELIAAFVEIQDHFAAQYDNALGAEPAG